MQKLFNNFFVVNPKIEQNKKEITNFVRNLK